MKHGTYRDVSDDACDVACDHLVIEHNRFTSSLHPNMYCNICSLMIGGYTQMERGKERVVL